MQNHCSVLLIALNSTPPCQTIERGKYFKLSLGWGCCLPPALRTVLQLEKSSQSSCRLHVGTSHKHSFQQRTQHIAGEHTALILFSIRADSFSIFIFTFIETKTSKWKSRRLFIKLVIVLFLCSIHSQTIPLGTPELWRMTGPCLHFFIFLLNSGKSGFYFQPLNWRYVFQSLPIARVAKRGCFWGWKKDATNNYPGTTGINTNSLIKNLPSVSKPLFPASFWSFHSI